MLHFFLRTSRHQQPNKLRRQQRIVASTSAALRPRRQVAGWVCQWVLRESGNGKLNPTLKKRWWICLSCTKHSLGCPSLVPTRWKSSSRLGTWIRDIPSCKHFRYCDLQEAPMWWPQIRLSPWESIELSWIIIGTSSRWACLDDALRSGFGRWMMFAFQLSKSSAAHNCCGKMWGAQQTTEDSWRGI